MAATIRVVIAQELGMLDTHAVARITGMSEVTLHRWRMGGSGPPFVRMGRSVRYHPSHVERWALDNTCNPLPARGGQGNSDRYL
ncbi:putative DNA-binding transcriptional regulator AlpA [Granulicella aggregans]|uniref:Putative DNA-binding transcriptional regulator AlpA n=1 Tax=Granulicella aggregans TaxID=474949 RepID=A0A7W7ZCS8_9BACT|nr:helix-turn-helix domain-containing protein [Granulicella aggregans]MBB5057442.1 putative DNA-binding transcriptional regulator AlpA [Granulicella aggregans]